MKTYVSKKISIYILELFQKIRNSKVTIQTLIVIILEEKNVSQNYF